MKGRYRIGELAGWTLTMQYRYTMFSLRLANPLKLQPTQQYVPQITHCGLRQVLPGQGYRHSSVSPESRTPSRLAGDPSPMSMVGKPILTQIELGKERTY